MRCAGHEKWHSDMTKCCACQDKRHCYITKWPNAAPATKIRLQPSHMKRHLQCAGQQGSPSNLAKYCACHAKFVLQNLREICRKKLKRHLHRAPDSTMIRTWSDHELVILRPPVRRGNFFPFELRRLIFHGKLLHCAFRAIFPKFTKCFACHEKRYSDITKCCVCHRKWHRNINKCCACHEKWEGFHDGS